MTLEFAGNVLCSAGVSYFHVYPNGDVYRCLADYNARRPPMFNLKRDGWKGAVDPTRCDHERCYNACDLDWTTKWQVDGQGQLEKTYEGQRKDTEANEVGRFLWSQRLEAPERRMAYFIWSPTLACNYTCAYCGCAAGEKRIKKDVHGRLRFVCLVAAPEGLAAMAKAHPEVPIWCAAVDRQLDERGYIRPGLGDAGDRIFGTD